MFIQGLLIIQDFRIIFTNPAFAEILGYSIGGQAQEIMARGCDGFIQKPFSVEELSQKIGEIVKEKHS